MTNQLKIGLDSICNATKNTKEHMNKVVAIFEAIEDIVQHFKKNDPVHIDELAKKYSEVCDRIIIDSINNEELIFVGGKLTFNLNDDKESFTNNMEIYFNNSAGEWVKKGNESVHSIGMLTSNSNEELKKCKSIEYEIQAPNLRLEKEE